MRSHSNTQLEPSSCEGGGAASPSCFGNSGVVIVDSAGGMTPFFCKRSRWPVISLFCKTCCSWRSSDTRGPNSSTNFLTFASKRALRSTRSCCKMPAVARQPQKSNVARHRLKHRTLKSQARIPKKKKTGMTMKKAKRKPKKPQSSQQATMRESTRLYTGRNTIAMMILYEATTSKAFTLTVDAANACAFSRLARVAVNAAMGSPTIAVGIDSGARTISSSAASKVFQAMLASATRLNLTSRSRSPAALSRSTYSVTSAISSLILSSPSRCARVSANILFSLRVSSGDSFFPLGLYNALIVSKAWSSP
mmetsp:Transcript_30084/g.75935  ORF Transcript_30084/g.75935 Transcript_30084/m.75935 type:complete len:308 (+) Transcript_30084:153-1076(+)